MSKWQHERVLIFGAARQGLALARYLIRHGARVTLNDQRSDDQLAAARTGMQDLPVTWITGGHPLEALDGVTLVAVSGGVPLDLPAVQEAFRRGIPVTNDSQIFMEAVPCPVVGITGSAGKTTTTTLVGRMAEAAVKAPRQAWVGGNIGQPLIEQVEEMKADDLVVLELSSFQLELMTLSPQVAAVLNITPNHLDRHKTMQAYTEAKAHILTGQSPQDAAVLGRDDPGSWALSSLVRGRLVSFGLDKPAAGCDGVFLQGKTLILQQGSDCQPLFDRSLVALRGEHNLYNVLAACAVAHAAGLPPEAMQTGVQDFKGVPHRLEFVRSWGGAAWYNDSIATAPERAMAALRSFDEPVILLAGGRDKNLPWSDFADLVHQRVDHLVLFGEAAGLIQSAVGSPVNGRRPFTVTMCATLQDAVQAAAGKVEPGYVVLLSPGGTSYDAFRDFEERGEWYRTWVKALS